LYNIFIGLVLYVTTRAAFKREHTRMVLNAFLWLVLINIVEMCLQHVHLSFLFAPVVHTADGAKIIDNSIIDAAGIMCFKAAMGMVMACGVPVLLSRWNRYDKSSLWCLLGAIGLAIPLYISRSSMACMAALTAGLIVLWYKIDRKAWYIVVGVGVTAFACFVAFVDAPMGFLTSRLSLWQVALKDAIVHPVVGWGLDSFRQVTEWKKHIYAMDVIQHAEYLSAAHWDNPHSLPVSIAFEWGAIGVAILVGFVRDIIVRFRTVQKTDDVLALFGFIVVILLVSLAQFPMFLARTACFIIPLFALYEIETAEA